MTSSVVIGAGPVGRETARILAQEGHEVRLVSRSGTKLAGSTAKNLAFDARDGNGLARICVGAETIFMCAMAPYDRWPTDFPPIMDGVVKAAEGVGARLVVVGNLYVYGKTAASPLTSVLPVAPTSAKGRVRTDMWKQALASSVPAIEVRASDYLGEGAGSLFTLMSLPALLDGKPVFTPGDLDALHPWSFTKDVARTLVAASRYTGDWGRAFHVPSQHTSIRDLASRFAAFRNLAAPQLQALTFEDLNALGRENSILREIIEIAYLYERSSVLDASDTERLLGVSASSLDAMIRDTLQVKE